MRYICIYFAMLFFFLLLLQKFPKDGVKKLALQMEKQKLIYEEKALSALQKAMQEKTEALTNADILQVRTLDIYKHVTFT